MCAAAVPGKQRAPAALPLKKASTPPLRHVLMTVSRMLDLLPAVIMLSRIFSKGAVAVLETAPVTRASGERFHLEETESSSSLLVEQADARWTIARATGTISIGWLENQREETAINAHQHPDSSCSGTCKCSRHEAPSILGSLLHPAVQVRAGVLCGLHAMRQVQPCQAGADPRSAADGEQLKLPMVCR